MRNHYKEVRAEEVLEKELIDFFDSWGDFRIYQNQLNDEYLLTDHSCCGLSDSAMEREAFLKYIDQEILNDYFYELMKSVKLVGKVK